MPRLNPGCWFAQIPEAGPCDGELVRVHLIPRQTLRKEFGKTLGNKLAEDPASFVPGCGGPTGIGGHHGMLDSSRKLRVPRELLPELFVKWCESLGLGWYIDREYGPEELAA